MSTINALIFFLLGVGFVLSSPLAAGGDSSLDTFYCEAAQCAANVSKVFCDDQRVFENKEVADCRGLPSLHSVCLHDGRAFVSTLKATKCEFESKNSYIVTTKCTDLDPICSTLTLITLTTPSPPASDEQKPEWTTDKMIYIIVSAVCGIVLLGLGGVALIWYCCRKRQTQGPDQPAPDPTRNPPETIPLRDVQTSGGINDSRTEDGNTSPHRGRGD